MAKRKIIIEEIISQEFEVDVDESKSIYEQVRTMYKESKLVVDNPTLTEVNVMICDEDGEETDWTNLHVI